MKIVFLDTETTSLRPDRRAWEVGIILRTPDGDIEHQWFINADDLDLGNADLISLNIGKFFERHPGALRRANDPWTPTQTTREAAAMHQIEQLTRGAYIVGAVPNFDTDVLSQRMRANGICPSWNYHIIDVETLAAGALKLPPKWDFDQILATYNLTYNLTYDKADRHTALGDARMARDLYDTVMTVEPAATIAGRLIEAAS